MLPFLTAGQTVGHERARDAGSVANNSDGMVGWGGVEWCYMVKRRCDDLRCSELLCARDSTEDVIDGCQQRLQQCLRW
jgi:hypothetical protein